MITLRPLAAGDIAAVADFATRGMDLSPHLGVRLSPAKIEALVSHFHDQPLHFHLCAFDGAKVVGVIGALVSEMLFFERCEATVVVCQARGGPPGVGVQLIQALREWADADLRIRRVQFPEVIGARPGFARLLRRYGFGRAQRVLLYEKE